MRDENLHKLSALADRTISDPVMANILLCYVMQQISQPIDSDLLYDIAVTNDIINYFAFQEALQAMEDTGAVSLQQKNGVTYYTLTPKGAAAAERLHHLTGKSYRERITQKAQAALLRRKNEEQVKLSYEKLPQGCHLHVRIIDHELILLELTIFTPDEYQAKRLGDKILSDPSAIYHKILRTVMPDSES